MQTYIKIKQILDSWKTEQEILSFYVLQCYDLQVMPCCILAAPASGALTAVSPMIVGSILSPQAVLSIPSSDLSPHGDFKLTRRNF